MQRTTIRRIIRFTILGTLLLGLSSCINDYYDDVAEYAAGNGGASATVGVSLTIQARAMSNIQSDSEEYVEGTQWENYINMYAGDYRIYFFTYNPDNTDDEETNNILIAEFAPSDIYSTDAGLYTTYTLSGEIGADVMADYTSFKVLVAANWGSYPSVTAGTTTIDDLCEGTNSTYSASSKFTLSENNLIPFYGVQEYSGVTFKEGTTTSLDEPVSLLRAVAKVEVIMTEESSVEAFDDVSIVNYNAQGYCAPAGVYVAADYNTDYNIQPGDNEWPNVFVKELHLVNNSNDTETKTQTFTEITSATLDTWRIYVPEYDNTGTDYSYITVTIDGEEFNVYFADYTDGETDNSDTSKRYNLKRNNLYRFYVTISMKEKEVTSMKEKEVTITISVRAETWEKEYNNTFNF